YLRRGDDVEEMGDHYVKVRHLDPRFKGQTHCITKQKLTPPETANQQPLYDRYQYPFRVSYAVTINKSQGQTFERVGILLQHNIFSHGQLYVALSRVHTFSDLKIFTMAKVEGVEGVVLA
ncbi:hypothetical protein PMAYCL1PPCAC_08878, partial [Pristionchus mayeri]